MFKTMTLALAGLALAGLAACGNLSDKLDEQADPSDIPVAGSVTDAAEQPAADLPEVDPVEPVVADDDAGSSMDFVLASNDAGHADDAGVVGDHFTAIGGYAGDFDFAGAEAEARAAQALLQDMHTEALDFPGAGSPAGVATIEAYDICYWAMDTTADAMDDVDVNALETVAAEIGECVGAIEHATAIIPG